MFTGLIEDIGKLVGLERHGKAAKLSVGTTLPLTEIAVGDSIAVNGACLTVESAAAGVIHFHTLAETLSRTNLGLASKGTPLNLERALCVGSRLGGHIVTGHVDYCAEVLSAGRKGDDFELEITIPEGQQSFFVEKGSVAVNGVSLTIAGVKNDRFKVCLIPLTQSKTNLDVLKPSAKVNIETDILGKYVVGMLHAPDKKGITMDTLINAGF
jgi:riboflavin synthase